MITSSLGNTMPGFNDTDTVDAAAVGVAVGGQPAPFDQGYGSDELGLLFGTFDQTWQHTYTAIGDPILSATLTIGIWDHDSAASGDQVAELLLDTSDQTATLNTAFEAKGGTQTDGVGSEFNTYSLDLLALGLAGLLTDGVLDVALELKGPALIDPFLGPVEETSNSENGANLIFSSLIIETQDNTTPPPGVPVPATIALLGIGLLAMRRFRVRQG